MHKQKDYANLEKIMPIFKFSKLHFKIRIQDILLLLSMLCSEAIAANNEFVTVGGAYKTRTCMFATASLHCGSGPEIIQHYGPRIYTFETNTAPSTITYTFANPGTMQAYYPPPSIRTERRATPAVTVQHTNAQEKITPRWTKPQYKLSQFTKPSTVTHTRPLASQITYHTPSASQQMTLTYPSPSTMTSRYPETIPFVMNHHAAHSTLVEYRNADRLYKIPYYLPPIAKLYYHLPPGLIIENCTPDSASMVPGLEY